MLNGCCHFVGIERWINSHNLNGKCRDTGVTCHSISSIHNSLSLVASWDAEMGTELARRTYGLLTTNCGLFYLPRAAFLQRLIRACLEACTSLEDLNSWVELSTKLILDINVGSTQDYLCMCCTVYTQRSVGFLICSELCSRLHRGLSDEIGVVGKSLINNVSLSAKLLRVCTKEEEPWAVNFLVESLKTQWTEGLINDQLITNGVSHFVSRLKLDNDGNLSGSCGSLPGCTLFLIDIGAAVSSCPEYWCSSTTGMHSEKRYQSVNAFTVYQCCYLMSLMNARNSNVVLKLPTHVFRNVINRSSNGSTASDSIGSSSSRSNSSIGPVRTAPQELFPQVLCVWTCRAEESFTGSSACQCDPRLLPPPLSVEVTLQLAEEALMTVAVLLGSQPTNPVVEGRVVLERYLRIVCQLHECRCLLRQCQVSLNCSFNGNKHSSPMKSPTRGIKRPRQMSEESPHLSKVREVDSVLAKLCEEISIDDLCLSLTEMMSSDPSNIIEGTGKTPDAAVIPLFTDAGLGLVSLLSAGARKYDYKQAPSNVSRGIDQVIDQLVSRVPALLRWIESARIAESKELAYGDNHDGEDDSETLCRDCQSKTKCGAASGGAGSLHGITTLCGRPLRVTGLRILLLQILLLCSGSGYTLSEERQATLRSTLRLVLQGQLDVIASCLGASIFTNLTSCDTGTASAAGTAAAADSVVFGVLWRLASSVYAASDRTSLAFPPDGKSVHLCGLDTSLGLIHAALKSSSSRVDAIAALKIRHCSDAVVRVFAGTQVPGSLNQHCQDHLWYLFWNSIDDSQRVYTAAFILRSALSGVAALNKAETLSSPARERTRQKLLELKDIPMIPMMRGQRSALRYNAVLDKLEDQIASQQASSSMTGSNGGGAMEIVLDENSNTSFTTSSGGGGAGVGSGRMARGAKRTKKRVFRPLQSLDSHSYYLLKMLSTLPALLATTVFSVDCSSRGLVDLCGLLIWLGKTLKRIIEEELNSSSSCVYKEFLVLLMGSKFTDTEDWCTVMSVLADVLNEKVKVMKATASPHLLSWLLTALTSLKDCCDVVQNVLCPSYQEDLSDVLVRVPAILKSVENGIRRLKAEAVKRKLKIESIGEENAVVEEEGSSLKWNEDFSKRMNEFIDECETAQ